MSDVGWAGISEREREAIEGPRVAILIVSSAALALLLIQRLRKKKR